MFTATSSSILSQSGLTMTFDYLQTQLEALQAENGELKHTNAALKTAASAAEKTLEMRTQQMTGDMQYLKDLSSAFIAQNAALKTEIQSLKEQLAASASASAPPPLVLKPSYSPPTDPGAMAPRLQGDDRVLCICGELAEVDRPYCSFGCECHARYLEETGYLASERREEMAQAAREAQAAQGQKTQTVEDICPCGKPAEDGLPYCSLACECQAKYEEDEEWPLAQKTQTVEDSCMICGKPAEDDLPFCSLACECQARYEEDQQSQEYEAYYADQAAKMKEAQQAQETQKAEGH
jgi:regulator of replication initiation timing